MVTQPLRITLTYDCSREWKQSVFFYLIYVIVFSICKFESIGDRPIYIELVLILFQIICRATKIGCTVISPKKTHQGGYGTVICKITYPTMFCNINNLDPL